MSLDDSATVRIGDGPEIPFRDFERAAKNASRMRETDADREVRDRAYRTTAEELLGFITEIERHEAEKAEVQDQIKAIYEQANSRGYDKKALKVIVAERKADKDKLAELHAVLDTYRTALGM